MSKIIYSSLQEAKDYVEKKALELMAHEEKDHAAIGVPFQNYRFFTINDRTFYLAQTNIFRVIMEEDLTAAQDRTPANFGTGNAHDVIKALWETRPIFALEAYTEELKDEKWGYVVESEDGKVVDRILRLDLFRMLRPACNENYEFVGGVFHAFKHFSRNGTNYSIGKSNHELSCPYELIKNIIESFFILDGKFETDKEYVVLKSHDEKYNMKYVFYREEKTNVFFLKTAYKEPIK